MKPAFLPLNLHRSLDDGCPTVALVDAELLDSAALLRWLTTLDSDRPMHSAYQPGKAASRLVSLSRWVWTQADAEPPQFIGHANGDLLDCRRENLVRLRHPGAGKNSRSGQAVVEALIEAGQTPLSVREAFGYGREGEPRRRGRALPYTGEEADELRRLRDENPGMPLNRFNAEIVAEVVGKKLCHRVLTNLLSNQT